MYCIECGAAISAEEHFCNACGTSQPSVNPRISPSPLSPASTHFCMDCGAEISEESNFCKMCGASKSVVDAATIAGGSNITNTNSSKRGKRWMYIICICLILSGMAYIGINNRDSNEIKQVKGGVMQLCPSHTVNQMVQGFMGSPSWKSGKSEDGRMYVNVEGDITFHDKPVRATVQFLVQGDTFSFNAFEMNGVPSANIIAIALLNKMCESASGTVLK
jgi:hypothetical protein